METILVVEDETSLRENIQETLELNNYRIITAENGISALKVCEHETPDLVVSDIMMPGMDGYQMLEEFQKNPRIASIPFIFLTAKSGETDIRKGMTEGADDYITKPFKVKDLLQAVAVRLKKKKKIDTVINETTNSISQYIPHELRTPLVSILGFTQILIEDNEKLNKVEVSDYLVKIKKASSKLHKTIERFILYSEVALGKYRKVSDDETYLVTEDEIRLNLNKIMEPYNRQSDIRLHLETCKIKILKNDFLIILEELVDNALKFSYPGTEIKINGIVENNKYKMDITDLGKGISEKNYELIAPFIQPDRNVLGQEGNGLGLAIVQKLISLYNATFEIVSKENQFTRINFTFPIAGQK